MTLPNDRGVLCLMHSREEDEQQEMKSEDEEGWNKSLRKLQECDTDGCIIVSEYVTFNWMFIFSSTHSDFL